MVLLKWGWVHQRIALRFRPTVWKKRYLVLTTMSIHVHKSEKGVISSLFPDSLPTVHVWSNFISAQNYTTRGADHGFIIEPKDPTTYPLKFKCSTLEEKEKWVEAIKEQLALTSKIWSQTTIPKTVKCITQTPIVSPSVLDKWLDQLSIAENAITEELLSTEQVEIQNSF